MDQLLSASERRNSHRLLARDEMFLHADKRIHQILDISEGGLAFRCMTERELPKQWVASILFPDASVHLKNLEVKLIRESNEMLPSFASIPTKKVGVQFISPNEASRATIKQILAQLDGALEH